MHAQQGHESPARAPWPELITDPEQTLDRSVAASTATLRRHARGRLPVGAWRWLAGSLGIGAALLLTACGGTEPAAPAPGEPTVGGRAVHVYYARNCATCHGMEREGRIGPGLTPDSLTEPDEVYVEAILNGRPGTAMPAFGGSGRLSAAEVELLVDWLRTASPRSP